MTDASSVRLGIVGCGNIGRHHAERLGDEGATLVGAVDVDPDAREAFAERFDVDTYEDHAPLYDAVDAVVVATPNKFHERYAVDALDAGLDVLVEKPLAHTVESAERIADAAAGADGFCMVGFHTRFENAVEVLTGYRDAGRLGEVGHVEATLVRRRGVPGRGSWFTREAVAGGGALVDIGVHATDLALYLLGYPDVTEVSGVTRSQFGGREDYTYLDMWGEDHGHEAFDVDDSASAFVRCADGRTISLEVAWAANRPSAQEYVLRGTEGGATYDQREGTLTIHETSNAGAAHMSDTTVGASDNDAHADEGAYFLEHVASGTAPDRNTVDQALTVQRVLDAVYRSSERGEAVRLD
ncbi:MAG: Gfo/Idh/MocA family protein [Haloarculaceae archaeon]